jgi:hypothetical protein
METRPDRRRRFGDDLSRACADRSEVSHGDRIRLSLAISILICSARLCLKPCTVSVDGFIIDKFKTRYELDDLNVNAGLPLGEDRFVQPVRVPLGVEPGPAIYRTTSTYICNPMQKLWPIAGGTRDISFLIR